MRIFPLKMVIFHSYVTNYQRAPVGISIIFRSLDVVNPDRRTERSKICGKWIFWISHVYGTTIIIIYIRNYKNCYGMSIFSDIYIYIS